MLDIWYFTSNCLLAPVLEHLGAGKDYRHTNELKTVSGCCRRIAWFNAALANSALGFFDNAQPTTFLVARSSADAR